MASSGALLFVFAVSVAVSAVFAYDCADVTRSQWGAKRHGRYSTIPAVSYVFIHHSASATCNSLSTCSAKVRSFQNYHMNGKKWSDIGYSFLVGGDGRVYQGRGWNVAGAHTYNYNSRGVGISLIGNFTKARPTWAQLAATQELIACGVRNGYIRWNYKLLGHRDVSSSTCPGNVLYGIIRRWDNFAA